jgi:hypothetical protein
MTRCFCWKQCQDFPFDNRNAVNALPSFLYTQVPYPIHMNIYVELSCDQTFLIRFKIQVFVADVLPILIVGSLPVMGSNDTAITSSLCLLFPDVVSVLLDSEGINSDLEDCLIEFRVMPY